MKIANITLRNFRCHEDARFDLQPVTVFTGPNGSGKSSVGEALRLALTGKTETLNDRNESIADGGFQLACLAAWQAIEGQWS